MAALETTVSARPEVVLDLVRQFAEQELWTRVSEGTQLVFVRTRAVNLAASGQEVTVTVGVEDADHSIVTVETKALNAYGGRQLFDWGQGRRVVTGLLDFVSESCDQ